MSHSIKARGQLRHHFHGKYSATIILMWDTVRDAKDSVKMMGTGRTSTRFGWEIYERSPGATIWTGNSDDLAVVTEQLVSFGAERDKIASVAKSIDFGEKFEITIPDVPDAWS